ncbi:MAG: hypothetical protein LBD56_01190 [Endomicrobium sp.]|jgi:hypothetical protein|nr:hypothetical protein [Endomicrobium sp.]
MKLINSFYTITLVSLLVIVYSSIAIGDNHVIKRYTVKINGISFSNNVATNILFYITNGNDNAIKSYDNLQKREFMLSKIEENIDVSIQDNGLLSVILDLYKNLFENKNADYKHSKMGDMSCISGNVELDKKSTRIKICIDDGKVSYFEM